MSRIVDALNEVLEVATWTESPEPFFVVWFEKSKNNDGFDWIKLNDSGKIMSHHGIGLTHATYFADEKTSKYVKKDNSNSSKIQDILAENFNIYSVTQGDKTYYTSQQWLHFPELNSDVNLILKVKGETLGSNITFDIPTGIQMTYNTEGDTYVNIVSCTPIPVQNDLKLRIRATNATGESTIIVRDMCENYIGELGVLAYDAKTINLKLWSLVSNPNGKKTVEKITEEGNNLMLQNKKDPENQEYILEELNALKAEMKRVYSPLNIHFNITVSNKHLTYNPKDNQSFKPNGESMLHSDTTVKYNSGGNFLEEVSRLNSSDLTAGFIHVIIAQCTCETNNHSIKGIGQIGRNCTIMYKNDRTTYSAYTHEVGHNLNLCHSFQKDDDPAFGASLFYLAENQKNIYWAKHDAVYDRLDKEQKLPEDSKTILTPAEQSEYEELRKIRIIEIKDVNGETLTDDEEKIRKASETTSAERLEKRREIFEKYYDGAGMGTERVNDLKKERGEMYNDIDKVLYKEAISENVMDYSGIYNFFFKWQWKIIRNHIINL